MPGIFDKSFARFCARIWKSQKGATAIEYGLIAALISLGALAAFSALGDSISTVFSSLTNDVENAIPGDRGGGGGGNTPSDSIG